MLDKVKAILKRRRKKVSEMLDKCVDMQGEIKVDSMKDYHAYMQEYMQIVQGERYLDNTFKD